MLGTLTDRDIAHRLVARGRPLRTLVADVMTCEVIRCHPSDDLDQAERLMAKHKVPQVLCTRSDGRLTGLITLSTIVRQEPGERAAQVLRDVLFHPSALAAPSAR